MKISFFSQLLLDKEKTGIGWCADNIVKQLTMDKNNDCELDFFAIKNYEDKCEIYKEYIDLGCSLNPCKWFIYILYKLIWNVFPVPYTLFFGKRENIHIFFNYVIPPGVKGTRVVFVYDMAYKTCPGTVYSKTRNWLNMTMPSTIRRADMIVTISEFSKTEIMKYFKLNEENIVVIPMGVDRQLYHNHYSKESVEEVKEKYGIDSRYFLYLGTLEPRKNIVNIIEAYHALHVDNYTEVIPKLVLAGRKGWMYDEIFAKVKDYGMEEDVIFTGYMDEKEAPKLMHGAIAFVFPSLYEGFGMPPLEAMACGTPVITSNTSALPEVVGNAGIQVNPNDTFAIKEAMKDLDINLDRRKTMSAASVLRSDKFTWKTAADILINEFKKANLKVKKDRSKYG